MADATEAMARAVDAVRVNVVERAQRGDRRIWIKRRRRGMGPVIVAGNLFLRASRSGVVMFPSLARWKRRELFAFRALHGADAAGDAGPRALWTAALPGDSLKALLAGDRLERAALSAAALALREAHELVDGDGAPFSHGDPHLDNVLFDGARARLIDFDTAHAPGLEAPDRHADDLLVLVLDLLGGAGRDDAVARAWLLLQAYGEDAIWRRTLARLYPPRGLEAVLWSTRTGHLDRPELAARLSALRRIAGASRAEPLPLRSDEASMRQ